MVFCMILVLLSCVRGYAGAKAQALGEISFEVFGESGQAVPGAQVRVESLRPNPEKRRFSQWIRFEWMPRFVAEGVSVRLERLEFSALRQLPMKLQEKVQGRQVEMRQLRIFAPGDTVPRLIAKEVEVQSNGIWVLRRVLLAGKPSISACTLHLDGDGDPRIRAGSGKSLSLKSLISDPGLF
jgi:hypothetical protein